MKTDEILGKEIKSIKRHALSIICCPEFHTKEEVKEAYDNISKDTRLSQNTRNEILKGLKRVYKMF